MAEQNKQTKNTHLPPATTLAQVMPKAVADRLSQDVPDVFRRDCCNIIKKTKENNDQDHDSSFQIQEKN